MKKRLHVINTGGTFNKTYNPLNGELIVPKDYKAVQEIVKSFYNLELTIENIIHKDSLEFTDEDREFLAQSIARSEIDDIVVIHGTDTIDKSAIVVKGKNIDKRVIFTGSMVPFSIEQVEATANLSLAIGFLSAKVKNGVYVAMHGVVADAKKLTKNREIGQFLLS